MRCSLLSFITNLYTNLSMAEALLQKIITATNELISNKIMHNLKNEIEPILNIGNSKQK